ncbi:protein kinase [Achlya hypogyna]|uniref:Protein kinase n=1 Tax=Achlya hypogyna TaxID=1202772 RepID=A0A1V9Y665_ACHHY|nr:protein kinase [Achlya hypogyna]
MSLRLPDEAPTPRPRGDCACRALLALCLHVFASVAVAAPIWLSSAIASLLPGSCYHRGHVAVLRVLWSLEWRLLELLVQPQEPFALVPAHDSIAYGFVYFGLLNLLDVAFAALPLTLIATAANVVYLLATQHTAIGATVIEVVVVSASLVAAVISARIIEYRLHVPFIVAWTQAQPSCGNPRTPRTPAAEDWTAHDYANMLEAKMARASDVPCAARFLGAYTAHLRAAADAVAAHCTRNASLLPLYTIATSSSPPQAVTPVSTPLAPFEPPTKSTAAVSTPTFPAQHFAGQLQQPVACAPSAPVDDELTLAGVVPREREASARRQFERRQSLSSSDEEDFQTLCDSILRRNGRRYDVLSPPASPPRGDVRGQRSVPSSTSSVASDLIFRGLDDGPRFTAYAPRRVAMGAPFDLSVFCFGARDKDEVDEVARATDGSTRNVTRTLEVALARGTLVTVSLDVPAGFRLLDLQHMSFHWTGALDQVVFPVFCQVHGTMSAAPHVLTVKIVAQDFVGVLHCSIVVGPRVPTRVQCQEEWYRLVAVSDELEQLAPGFDEIRYADLHMKRWIGAGYFGDAYLASYRGRDVVVKTLRQASDEVATLRHEAAVSALLGHHPCIVPFVGACTTPSEPLALVTEYMPLGSLQSVVAAPAAAHLYPVDVRTHMLHDAANGLLHLHANNFVHRDMAARNCLVALDGQVKVADFGLARRGELLDTDKPSVGPLKWMAPESLQPPHLFSPASDVFSFGVTMWEVYSGEKPFSGSHALEVAVRVCEGDRLPLAGKAIPAAQIELMGRCFAADPQQRPTMAEIYHHLGSEA